MDCAFGVALKCHCHTQGHPAILSGRKLPIQPLPKSQTIQVFLICPWHLLSCCPSAGVQSEWVWVHLWASDFRGKPGTPEVLCLTQPQSPLVFTTWSYGDFSSQHWNLGWGCPGHAFQWGSLQPSYPSCFNHHMWVCGQPILCLHPSYQSWHGFFCISFVTELLFN